MSMDSQEGIALWFQCGLYRERQLVTTKEIGPLRQQALIFLERKVSAYSVAFYFGDFSLEEEVFLRELISW